MSWRNSNLDYPLNQHQQVAMSYKNQIESAEKRGDKDEANSVRKEFEIYEKAWRAGQSLEQSHEEIKNEIILFGQVKLPEKSLFRINSNIKDIEISPIPTGTATATLGTAYFALAAYDKASEYFKISLESQPDNTDVRVLQAGTLISIAASPQYDNHLETQLALLSEANDLTDSVILSFQQKQFIDNTKRVLIKRHPIHTKNPLVIQQKSGDIQDITEYWNSEEIEYGLTDLYKGWKQNGDVKFSIDQEDRARGGEAGIKHRHDCEGEGLIKVKE